MSIEDRLARSASTLDEAIETRVAGGGRRRRDDRWIGVAAAGVLVVGGVVGLSLLSDRPDVTSPGSSSESSIGDPSTPEPTAVESGTGSALTTPLASDVQALVVPSLPGWRVEATAGFQPVTVEPSTACPGCGPDRLVLVGDAGLSGPVFTAWSVDVPVKMDDFDHDATVGAVAARVNSSPIGTPLSETRVTAVWRLGDGPGALTAFVDAKGLSEAHVLEWAALLSWEGTVPTMAVLPAGFTNVDAPSAAPVTLGSYLSSADGRSVIELYAVNTGIHGLVDWRSLGPLLHWTSEQRTVDGVDVALDPPEPADEHPITTISATWIAGGWGYVAVGHIFDSEQEFLDTVRSLRLVDPATYAGATAAATGYFLPEWVSTTGWNLSTAPG